MAIVLECLKPVTVKEFTSWVRTWVHYDKMEKYGFVGIPSDLEPFSENTLQSDLHQRVTLINLLHWFALEVAS